MAIESYFNGASRASSSRDKRRLETPDCTPSSNKKHKTTRKIEIELSESTISALQQDPTPESAERVALLAIKTALQQAYPASQGTTMTSTSTTTLKITERPGNIFQNPSNHLLIHACNCEGTWGAGIALAFKKSHPTAFQIYQTHCKTLPASQLIGTALLIPPPSTPGGGASIGCLFTSRRKGRSKDTPAEILSNTRRAMEDLVRQMEGRSFAGVRMCRINSGLFNVPWEDTKAVLKEIEVGDGEVKEIEVVTLAEEVEREKTKGGAKN